MKLLRFLPLTFDRITPQHDLDISGHAQFPRGFHSTNPSLLSLDNGYLVCVRGVNYTKGNYGQPPSFAIGNRYMTVNRFFLVNHAFQFSRSLPGLDAIFDDVEDIRLFNFDGKIMGIGNCAGMDGGADSRYISLLTIDHTFDGGNRRQIASPFGLRQEKNWAPFVYDGALHFIYSFDPLIVLRYDFTTGIAAFAGPRFERFTSADLTFLVSGSSAGLPVSDGFLFAAHRRKVSLSRRHESYLSRIYHLGTSEMILTTGRYFSIGAASIQFVNGLAQQGDDFVIAYGAMDQSAHLCRFPKSLVAPMARSRPELLSSGPNAS